MKRYNDRVGYIVAIIVNFILFYIFNHLLSWHIRFLLDSWHEPLKFINILLAGTILANIIYLFFDLSLFKAITKTILSILSFIFMFEIYRVFPFNFSIYPNQLWLADLVKILIIVSLSLTAVGIIVDFVKIFKIKKAHN